MVMVMNLYYMNIEELPADTEKLLRELKEAAPGIGKAAGQRIERYKRTQDRQRSLGAYLLLLHACTEAEKNLQTLCIRPDAMGKPFFVEPTEIGATEIGASEKVQPFFNLSHSGSYAVCVYDEYAECGVDIQKIRADLTGIAGRFFSEGERESLFGVHMQECDRAHAFTRIWSRKESLAKCIGSGLRGDLRELDTNAPEYRIGEIEFTENREYVLTYCSRAVTQLPSVHPQVQKICYNSQNGLHVFV